MGRTSATVATVFFLACAVPRVAGAEGEGLAEPQDGLADAASEEYLLEGITDAFAHGNASLIGPFTASVERDLPELQAELAPTLSSLPVGTGGRFGSIAVRYALHRLFMRLRGWSLVGLDPEGQAWNGTWTSKVVLLNKAPESVRTMIRQSVESPGLTAKGVAILAALIQHLAREDVAEHLRDIFQALDLPLDSDVGKFDAQRALDAHMASRVLSRSPTAVGRAKWMREVRQIQLVYPNWRTLQTSVHKELDQELPVRRTDFAGLAEVAGAIGERLGHWGDSECRSIKRDLMKAEDRGSGRVRLADFYGQALHEFKWQFSESVEYLRQLGALDETNPSNPRVIIPNYIGASGNCIASSDVMSVCCISECEDIMQRLEGKLSAPEATPEEIAAAIAGLPSSSVPVGRELSAVMLNRLNRIAVDNDGMVPVHGRLFAQWLHHAYPRECPYPHLAGRTRQQQMGAFAQQTGHSIVASRGQMAALAGQDARSWKRPGGSRPLENAPWSHEEELFVPLAQRPDAWAMVHASVLFAALAIGTLGYSLMHLARAARRAAAEAQADASKPYPV